MKHSSQVYFLSFITMTVMTGFGIIFPIFPKFLETFGGGVKELGIISATWAFSASLASPIAGRIADRYGKKLVIIVSLIGFAFSNFLFIFANTITDLVIIRAIEGGISAGIIPTSIALTSELSLENDRAKAIGVVSAGNSIGIVIGPLIGGAIYVLVPSFTVPFIFSGGMGLIGAFLAHWLLWDECKNNKMNNKTSKLTFSNIPKPIFSFVIFLFVYSANTAAWMLVEPGFSFYIYDNLGLQPIHFGLFVAVYGMTVAIGQALFGGVSDKYGRKPVIFIGGIINSFFYLIMIKADTFFLINVASIVAGLGLGLMFPALNALITEVTNEKYRATILGLGNSSVAISQILGPIIGSYYYDTIDHSPMQTLFLIAYLISVSGSFLALFLNFEENYRQVKIQVSSIN